MVEPSISSETTTVRRRSISTVSNDSNSPEFEFWMVRNPCSCPPARILSADELFSNGFLLPYHHTEPPQPELSTSKRWTVFKKNDEKTSEPISINLDADDRNTKKTKNYNGFSANAAAGSNIDIWPFSRSRSAGDGGARQRAVVARKVSSAPCSRSNSSTATKWRNSNSQSSRGVLHVGRRSSPVWQIPRRRRRLGGVVVKTGDQKGLKKDATEVAQTTAAAASSGSSKGRVLSSLSTINIPITSCMGYPRRHSCMSCTSGDSVSAVDPGGGVRRRRRRSNLYFNIRSLFSKKV